MKDLIHIRHALSTPWRLWGGAVTVGIASIPFALVLVAVLASRRRRGGADPGWATRSAFAEVFMVVGTAPWIWLILIPNRGHPRGLNLIPFADLINQVHVGHAYAAVQITGNLLVFASLGFCLPIRFRVGPMTSLAVGVVLSATVEAMQWYLRLGRFTSVDDVIVNASGAFLAAWLSRPWWRLRIGTGTTSRVRAEGAEPDRAVTSG